MERETHKLINTIFSNIKGRLALPKQNINKLGDIISILQLKMYNFRCKAKQSRAEVNKEVMRIKYKNVAVLTKSILIQTLTM